MDQPTEAKIGKTISSRRVELGVSQAELGKQVGVDGRQIRRYEAGEQQPSLVVGVRIAQALNIPVMELVGMGSSFRINLSGEWWMSWQTSRDKRSQVTAQTVMFTQEDQLVRMQTTSRGTVNGPGGDRIPLTVEDGGYHWGGELRIWDNRFLIGWYAATDGAVNSKGSLYFGLSTSHGQEASGIWTGVSHDGDLLSGWGALGKSESRVVELVDVLRKTRGAGALRTAPQVEPAE
jgi:DNA-binding XRE family transcriptional regulator